MSRGGFRTQIFGLLTFFQFFFSGSKIITQWGANFYKIAEKAYGLRGDRYPDWMKKPTPKVPAGMAYHVDMADMRKVAGVPSQIGRPDDFDAQGGDDGP